MSIGWGLMGSAAFLLAMDFMICVGFAVAFLALSWKSEIRLGLWCAAGFLAASAAVATEGVAYVFNAPWPRFVWTFSYASLLLAVTLITAGLSLHYRPQRPIAWLLPFGVLSTAINTFVLYDLPRALLFGICYHLPFTIILGIAAYFAYSAPRRRAADTALALVLAVNAVHFLAKALLIGAASKSGPGVRDYLVTLYAQISQTAGGILMTLLGLALLFVVGRAVMAEAARRLQRDSLSGALTRGAFLEEARAALAATPRGLPSILIMCDLDHFKTINDRYGHAAGDEVIRVFGASLGELTEGNGICGRIGGEEFCLLMPDCSVAAARLYLEAIQEMAAMTVYPGLPADFRATASFGIALTHRDERIEDAMRRADIALYEAKTAGRDAVRVAAATATAAARGPAAGPRAGQRA